MSTNVCPKGHLSSEADYCSECGSKIQTASEILAEIQAPANSSSGLSSSSPSGSSTLLSTTQDPFAGSSGLGSNSGLKVGSTTCPACSAAHTADDGNFCEICGYNFTTGQSADLPIVTLSPPLPIPADPTPIDPTPIAPTPIDPGEIAKPISTTGWSITIRIDPSLATPSSPPAPTQAPIVVPLNQNTNLIGRTSAARGVMPEIPLDFDDAISHRHALLIVQPDGSLILRDIGSSNGVQYKGQDLTVMADIPIQSGDTFSLGHWTTIEVQQQSITS